eukprot:6599252-Alexandrium_andersonii.AAC.1
MRPPRKPLKRPAASSGARFPAKGQVVRPACASSCWHARSVAELWQGQDSAQLSKCLREPARCSTIAAYRQKNSELMAASAAS